MTRCTPSLSSPCAAGSAEGEAAWGLGLGTRATGSLAAVEEVEEQGRSGRFELRHHRIELRRRMGWLAPLPAVFASQRILSLLE